MKTFDGYKKQALTDVYALLAGGGHKPLSEFSMAHTHPYLPLSGGTITGNIILKGGTSPDMTYAGNVHPYIRFDNSDSSQNISLIFTDYDSYRRPAGIKLIGNQGSEWFEAANIYATTFYGTLSGNSSTATALTTSAGSATLPIYFSGGKPIACTASLVFSNLSNSGNNISVTVAGQNRTLTVGYASAASKINSRGNLTAYEKGSTTKGESGLNLYTVYNNGYPVTFGNLLHINGSGAGQILAEWCGNSTLGHLYYRSKRDNSEHGWSTWGKIAFITDNVTSATKLQTARTIWGQSFNGTANVDNTLRIRQTTGNYCEGIRIQTADGAWSTIILGATADSGTNTNAWSIHRKADNNFAISRNSSDGINGLVMTSVGMGLGTTAPTYRLDVRGDTKITGSIRDLAIGGGIYWNPYVESTTDNSDAASITVVKSGVAGGTTLVLSQMNDSNDTIQFKTSTSARLYHNSYPILTTQNTYVSNNKGYINGAEIIQVNNADTIDGEHAAAFTRIEGRHSIYTSGTAPYNYIHLFRIANSLGYSTIDCEIDFRTRYHSAKLEIRISTAQYPYNSGGSSISIVKKIISGRSCKFWILPTVQSSNYNYYDVYYESGAWNSGSYGIIFKGSNGSVVFEHKGTNLASLPDKVTEVTSQWVSWDAIAGKPTSLPANGGNADTLDNYHANGLLTALSNSNNGVSITVGGTTKSISNISVNYANSAGSASSATKVIVNQHTTNDTNYPLVWSNQANSSTITENQLFKSWSDLYYNPKNKRLTVGGSVVASSFVKSGGTSQQLLRADGEIATFNWSGQSGQPTWLWGGNNQHSYYVYNPSNFRVAYASSSGNADTVDGYHASKFPYINNSGVWKVYGNSAAAALADNTAGLSTWAFGETRNTSITYLGILKPSVSTCGISAHGTIAVFGQGDTHLGIASDYSGANLQVFGGNADKIVWRKKVAFADGTGASGTWGININGNAATASKLGTSTVGATNVPIYLNGGTPTAVNLNSTANNLINNLTTGTSTPTDADYYVSQYVGGGTTTTTFHRRPHSSLYAYIKGKAEGTWGISITGNAATATNADKVDGYHASSLWRSDGATWNPGANVSLNASANSQEWSFDIRRNGYTGCIWHVWDSTLNSMLKVNADNGKVYAPYNFVGNLEGNASTASKWATARKMTLSGSVTGSVSIDGLGDVTLATTTNHTHNWANIEGKPSTFTPSTHTHSFITIPACSTLNINSNNFSVEYAGGNNSVTTKPSGVDAFGVIRLRTAAGWYGQIMMSANTAPGMYYRNANGLTSSVGWKKLLDSGNFGDYAAAKSHTHAISQITNLQATLDRKAAASHTHTWGSITSKPCTLISYSRNDENIDANNWRAKECSLIEIRNKELTYTNLAMSGFSSFFNFWTPDGIVCTQFQIGSNAFYYRSKQSGSWTITTNWHRVMDSNNCSVSKSGETLTVKINGTSQSLTNTWRGIQDNLTSSTNTTQSLSAKQGYLLANGSARDNTKLPLSGGTMTGVIKSTFKSSTWINGVTNAVVKGEYTDYGAILSMPVKTGRVSLSSYPANDNNIYFGYATTAQISAGTNSFNKQMYWDAANNNLHADVFTGSLVGNASTATNATNADKVDGQHFNWNNNKNDHTYLWAATDNGNAYLVHRASISVNYANSSNYANSADRAKYLSGHGVSPNNSHPGHGARVFYSWNIGQVGNDTAGYSNGITIGSNPGDTNYGFQIVQNMWDDRTYTRRYNGGWQSWKTLAWTSDIPTKSSWNYDDVYSKLGHTHDDRYYTESEVNNLLSNKLNISNFNWTNLSGKLVAGNEFNIVNDGFNTSMWFNHSPINDRSKTASINGYHFGNGAGGYTSIKASGFIKNGSNDNYVLLGGGGHKALSNFSMAHSHPYLPLSGGTMTGNITYTGKGTSYIGNGANDAANEVGGALNNLVISSWWGISFTTSCSNQTYTNKNAVSINCRNGYVYANTFVGAFSGNASSATNADKLDGKHASAFALSSHTHSYLPLAGGTMSVDARISYNSDGNLYIGNSSNDGWVYVQDMASQNGTTYWNITQAGSATFKGTVTAPKFSGNATTATTASKLGSSSVGSNTRHFYLNAGTATASTATVGGTAKPMYLKSGIMTAISVTVGSASKPVYLNGGTITACSSSLTDYLPLTGGSLSGDLYVTRSTTSSIWARYSSSAAIRVCASSSATHIQVGNFAWTANVPLYISGPNTNEGSTLYLKFSTVNASGNIQASHFYENSDIRYKRILKNLSINSNTIANLPLFDFEWIENNTIGTGTSAQAVQQILPNLVSGTDKLTLDYGVLGTIAGITACKELVTQKSELQQLKEKVKQLEDKLRKYENI